jgi:hypothetical protein
MEFAVKAQKLFANCLEGGGVSPKFLLLRA